VAAGHVATSPSMVVATYLYDVSRAVIMNNSNWKLQDDDIFFCPTATQKKKQAMSKLATNLATKTGMKPLRGLLALLLSEFLFL
jgi:hypothetical protein